MWLVPVALGPVSVEFIQMGEVQEITGYVFPYQNSVVCGSPKTMVCSGGVVSLPSSAITRPGNVSGSLVDGAEVGVGFVIPATGVCWLMSLGWNMTFWRMSQALLCIRGIGCEAGVDSSAFMVAVSSPTARITSTLYAKIVLWFIFSFSSFEYSPT